MSGTCSTFITAMAIWRAVLERSGFTAASFPAGSAGRSAVARAGNQLT
jgi:hypothetical protein